MRRQESGFTLLENIAALMLTGLLLSMLSVVTRQWLSNWNAGAKRAEDVEIIALATNRITDDLSGMLAIPGSESSPSLLFRGDSQSVNFIIDGNGPRYDGLFSVSLSAGEHGGLSRASRALQNAEVNNDDKWDEKIPLLPNEYAINFSYKTDNGSWRAIWTEHSLPKEIRVMIIKTDTPFSRPWLLMIKPNAPWPAICARFTEFTQCLAACGSREITTTHNIEKNKNRVSTSKNGDLP